MNRRRLVAAVFFSLVILAVLGVIVGAEVVSSGQTVSVLRLRVDVVQGSAFSASQVEVVPLRVAPGAMNYETPAGVPGGSRYAANLQSGDLLRPDDLLSGDTQIPITLTLTDPPPLQSGEAVDLFAEVPGTASQLLLGHALPLQTVDGPTVTLLVPSRAELAWLQIVAGNADLKLYALASVGPPPSGLAPDGIDEALCELDPGGCAALSVPTPLASAAPGGSPPSAGPTPSP